MDPYLSDSTSPPAPPPYAIDPNAWAPTVYPRPARKRWLFIAVAAAITVALATAGAGLLLVRGQSVARVVPAAVRPSPLRLAYLACGSVGDLSDGDRTLYLDMTGTDPDSGALSVENVLCVLRDLDTPEYVTHVMGDTRAIDGRQQGEWGRYSASWSYNPDDGLDILIRQTQG